MPKENEDDFIMLPAVSGGGALVRRSQVAGARANGPDGTTTFPRGGPWQTPSAQNAPAGQQRALQGFDREGSDRERALEKQFDSFLEKDEARDWMKRLSARPRSAWGYSLVRPMKSR